MYINCAANFKFIKHFTHSRIRQTYVLPNVFLMTGKLHNSLKATKNTTNSVKLIFHVCKMLRYMTSGAAHMFDESDKHHHHHHHNIPHITRVKQTNETHEKKIRSIDFKKKTKRKCLTLYPHSFCFFFHRRLYPYCVHLATT